VRNWQLYLLGLPALVLFVLFAYLPLRGVVIAFKDFSMTDGSIFNSPWIDPWYANFEAFFTGPQVFRVTRNVLVTNLFNMAFGTVVVLFFTICISEVFHAKMKKFYQSVLFLPFFLSFVVLGRLVQMLTDIDKGLLNVIIRFLGGENVSWTTLTWQWVFFLALVGTWRGLGYSMVIYLASLSGIPEELYEAAKIDGAGRMQMIRFITLPMLTATICIVLLLNVGRIFYGDFQMVQAVIGSTSLDMLKYTDNIETYLYRMTRLTQPPKYAMSTAVGIYQTLIGFIVIMLTNFIVKKINKDYALF
jgi:ABC-type polysaccharide transport system permease subunit